MKKSLFALLAASAIFLDAGDIVKYKNMNNINIGKSVMMVRKNGSITINTNGLIANISMPFKTHAGWSKRTSAAVFDDSQKNQILYTDSFPEKGANPVRYTRKVELTEDDKIVINYSAESAQKKNIQEFFCRVELSMKQYAGSDIEVNGQKFKVENITKYGWFRKTAEKPEVIFFKDGLPALRITSDSKMRMVGEARKDGIVGIRFYCAEGTAGELTVSYPDK